MQHLIYKVATNYLGIAATMHISRPINFLTVPVSSLAASVSLEVEADMQINIKRKNISNIAEFCENVSMYKQQAIFFGLRA